MEKDGEIVERERVERETERELRYNFINPP